jgi:PPE-repeat protein
MIDFGALPPEVNSARMYAGPGAGSLSAAAVAWDNLAAELNFAAGNYRSVVTGLTAGRWLGPASLSMASAFGPYVAWTVGLAARAAESAGQARLAVEAYEAAFTMTVPPTAVAANRVRLATLVATNFFGQNSAAIAATEAEYGEMWAQDAVALYEYAAHSAIACELTQLVQPPQVVNPAGAATQATAVANSAAASPAQQLSLTNLVSSIPSMLSALSSPASTLAGLTGASPGFEVAAYALPSWSMAAATPVYALSSILGIAQSGQGLAGAFTAVEGAAEGAAAEAAGAAASGAEALGSLGPGLLGSLGTATSLGPLSVPASWTSVIPSAQMISSVTPLSDAGLHGAGMSPNLLGAAPRAAMAGAARSVGPRYGNIPTIMARPPSGGYV